MDGTDDTGGMDEKDGAVTPGVALCQLRLAKGVGLRQLARDMPCNAGHLSRMESGVRPLSLECARMADRCLDTGPRAYAIHGAKLAHAYALAGHPDQVVRTLAEVLDTTAVIDSVTARRNLSRIRPLLESRWPRRSEVRDIAQRLAALA